jgi:hypothetical protein
MHNNTAQNHSFAVVLTCITCREITPSDDVAPDCLARGHRALLIVSEPPCRVVWLLPLYRIGVVVRLSIPLLRPEPEAVHHGRHVTSVACGAN